MHELSLSRAIVQSAERHAGGCHVCAIDLRIGCLRQVVPATLELCFPLVARGTLCEGAALRYEVVPATLRCRSCGREWELDAPPFRCCACEGIDVAVVAGDEFLIESIEVEEQEDACIAPG